MADGTIRCYVDIDMQCKDDFLANFPIDAPIAIARLTQEAAQASAQAETIADYAEAKEKEKTRLTGLALLAVQWCQMPEFWEWLNGWSFGPSRGNVASQEGAAYLVKYWCNVESRKELETNKSAARIFNDEIRIPFMAWLQDRG